MELLKKPHDLMIPAGMDLDGFEAFLVKAVAWFVQELTAQWVAQEEERWLQSAGQGFRSKGWQRRTVLTRWGALRVRFRKFYHADLGRSVSPMKQRLGKQRATRWVREMGVRLAREVSFAKASEFLGLWVGGKRSAKRVWLDLQEAGEKIERQWQAQTEQMYQTGEVVPAQATKSAVVALELDSTFVCGRRRGQSHEIKLAMAYTGKQQTGKQRWQLEKKQVWGGVMSAAAFGERLNVSLEQQYSISTAERVLGRSDGAAWTRRVLERLPVRVIHQLDLYHLLSNIRSHVEDVHVVKECQQLAYQGQAESLLQTLRRYTLQIQAPKQFEKALKLVHYVRTYQKSIDSLACYRQAARSEAEARMYCRGSGGIERNIAAYICDRMKRRRMHWSPQGAHYMVQVRTFYANQPHATIF